MPVYRYKSAADMPRPPISPDRDLLHRIGAVWRRAFELTPPAPPRGVQRFRSLEEANQARERQTIERMRAARRAHDVER